MTDAMPDTRQALGARQTPGRPQTRGARVAAALLRAGVFQGLIHARPNTLTVVVHHRITEPAAVTRSSFVETVSATPEAFSEQVRFLATHFNVITCRTLVDWLDGRGTLPPRAALITFDDGYRDNYDTALPILRGASVPAVLFAATGCIGSDRPFYWDLAAYCFGHTERGAVELPVLGNRVLDGEAARTQTLNEWIAAVKRLPDAHRREMVNRLPAALGVAVPDDAFAGLHLTWEQLREMAGSVFEIGAHTMSHPILSRVSPEQALREIAGSKRVLEENLGVPVTAFAYPNGSPADFGPEHETMLRKSGFGAAFTTSPGPTSRAEAAGAPLRIRRVNVTRRDTLAHFAAKVSGATALVDRLRAAPSLVLGAAAR